MEEAEKIFIRFASKVNKGYPDYTIKDREGFIKAIEDYAEKYHQTKFFDIYNDFKEKDIVVNQYGDVSVVLICNDFEFVVRRLEDNHVDNVTKDHYFVIYRHNV
jgi:hypothetical protein